MTVSELIALLQKFPLDATVVRAGGDDGYDLEELCESDVRSVELVRFETPEGIVIEEYQGDDDGADGPFLGVHIA